MWRNVKKREKITTNINIRFKILQSGKFITEEKNIVEFNKIQLSVDDA